MTVRARVVLLALAASCKSSSTTTAAPAGKPASATSAPVTPAPASGGADVAPLAVKTDTGGEVIGIGEPRLRLADGNFLGKLSLRAKAGLAAAEDAGAVTVWDLATGRVTSRIAPLPELNPLVTSFSLSPDGGMLATSSAGKTRLFKRPFDKPDATIVCSHAGVFSHDGKLLVCEALRPQVWSVADQKLVAKAPDAAFPLARTAHAVDFATDDQGLYWATDTEIVRWDFAKSGATTTVFKTKDPIDKAVFSENGKVAYVSTRPAGSYKRTSVLVDLATGQTSSPSNGYDAAVSPGGTLIAYSNGNEVKVVEGGSGKDIWSAKDTAPIQRVAFGADDVLGYIAGNQLHVVDLGKGPRAYDAPSRFAGWLGDGLAAIEKAGKLEQLSLADHKRSAADTSALAVKPPAGAPAWATWVTGSETAAEPSARHDAAPDNRGTTPCMPKLRVWTAKGGEKSLAMTCAKGDDAIDPGWDVNGTIAVGVGLKSATAFDATTGKKIGTIAVDKPRIDKPEFARSFWTMAVSPSGTYLALVSAGPQLPPAGEGDPREDAYHAAELHDRIDCEKDLSGECKLDYLLTIYSLTGTPTQVRKQPIAKPTSLAFDHAGKHLLVGTASGEIDVFAATGNDEPHVERFHHGAITRVVPAPGDHWVFSEDAAGQQRLWAVP